MIAGMYVCMRVCLYVCMYHVYECMHAMYGNKHKIAEFFGALSVCIYE
jgi:hypothetical protein